MGFKNKFYWFWKKLAEKNSRQHYADQYKTYYEYYNSYSDKKPKSQIKHEMKILQKYWGCYPFQYIRYGMYMKSSTLSIEEMKNYIPNFFAFYLFFPKHITEYLMISEDKELTYQVLKAMEVNQPKLVLQYKNGKFYSETKSILTNEEADLLIQQNSAEKLFLKPTKGLGGVGIKVFNKKEKFVDKDGNILSAEFIKNNLKDSENYLLQEGLIQHEELNKIYPNAVNTMRIYTEVKHGDAKLLFAILRMGDGGRQIDNASQSGFVCAINSETGELAPEATSRLFVKATHHLDTNFKFEGYKIPFWNEVKDFVIEIAQKTENIGFIGWDIAYTVNGPAVIEINAAPGLHSLQDSFGGARKAFGIKTPKTYWYSNNYIMLDK